MILLLKLSWRNVWRNRGRSLVVITSIGIGIFSLLVIMALVNGMNYQMIDNTISTSLGHVSIHKRGFMEDVNLSNRFKADPAMESALGRVTGLKGWAPRVKIQGIVRSSEASQGVMITGIDPEKEKSVSDIYRYTSREKGSEFLEDRDAGDVLISEQLAMKLDLVIGDRLVIMFQNASNLIVGEALTVRGIYRSPVESFDRYVIFTGIGKLQRVAGIGGSVSEISIRTVTRNDSTEVKKRISSLMKDPAVEIQTWQEMAPSMISAIKLYDSLMFIFFMIVFTTVIFSVANTMIMAVMDRFHEIGVMKCIGTRPLKIFLLIIFEALNLGIAGMAAGLVSGIGFNLLLGITGLDLSVFSESMRVWGAGSIIYPLIMVKDIAASAVIVLLTALIAAVYPAYRAAKIKPLEALNYI